MNALTFISLPFVDRIGSFLDLPSKKNYQKIVKQLAEVFLKDSVGLGIIYTKKERRPQFIKLIFKQDKWHISLFAHLIKNNKCVGAISFEIKPLNNDWINPYRNMGPHVYVKRLDGSDEHSGVGTHLMQAVMEYGLVEHDCSMRLRLEAIHNSHPFYWNLGLRTQFLECNQQIYERVCSLKKSGEKREKNSFPASEMLLFLDQASLWRERIIKNPILFQTRALLNSIKAVIPKDSALVFHYL